MQSKSRQIASHRLRSTRAEQELSAGRLLRIWRYSVSDGVPKRSLFVALIVGSILNLINQGDALLGGARPNLFKLLLTFAVPYLVATYGAVAARISVNDRGSRADRS
jgi:hypothetical protein